jgi:hypothetical protein
MTDVSALWREDATEEEQVRCYQHLINTGQAWSLEGHVGRTAMDLIERGVCALGPEPHRDYWGNRVPSRTEVQAGTKGSVEFVHDQGNEVLEDEDDPLGLLRQPPTKGGTP